MIIGPKYKICKRLGSSVFEKCSTQRFQVSEARSAKSKKRGRPGSEYKKQLDEKQKLRFTYGLSEKQFAGYVHEALESGSNPAEVLFNLLESRLDSVVYRMGLTKTRRAARQLVSHGHVIVNGRRVTIPSYQVGPSAEIVVREGSRTSALFTNLAERLEGQRLPQWVAFDPVALAGSMKSAPVYADRDSAVDLDAVFEYYTR